MKSVLIFLETFKSCQQQDFFLKRSEHSIRFRKIEKQHFTWTLLLEKRHFTKKNLLFVAQSLYVLLKNESI